jgi:hypothetical protein
MQLRHSIATMNSMFTRFWFYFYSFPRPLAEEIG